MGLCACHVRCGVHVQGTWLLRQRALPELGMRREQPMRQKTGAMLGLGAGAALGVAGGEGLYMRDSTCARAQDRRHAVEGGKVVHGSGPCMSCTRPVLPDMYTK